MMKKSKNRKAIPMSGHKDIEIGDSGVLALKWTRKKSKPSEMGLMFHYRPTKPDPITVSVPIDGNVAHALMQAINKIFDDNTNALPQHVRVMRMEVFGQLTGMFK